MKRLYFGTDGVRGPFGGPVVNPEFATRLAYAVGRWAEPGDVLIGRDTRASGKALSDALAVGFGAAGWRVIDLGIVPTPAVAREVRAADAALGVVITASHNPAEDNGIKFFGRGGIKLSDADEVAIEGLLPAETPMGDPVMVSREGAAAHYVEAMTALLDAGALAGWKIVVDTANGATVQTTPALLERMGAEVIRLGDAPDGTNINAAVGSEHPEQLAETVSSHAAALGIAHDGDGDRCIMCDERGDVLDGDEILTILALDDLAAGKLREETLVVTKQSNLGVDAAVRAAGGRVIRTDIGDRYVAEKMRETGAILGGESSGHIICDEIGPTGDGLGAAVKVLSVMQRSGKPLSVLRGGLKKYPQRSGAILVDEKIPLEDCPELSRIMKEIETSLGETGRLLVRYSGTESKIRLLVEGPDHNTVNEAYAQLELAVKIDLLKSQD